jgi:hypothetical protein
MAALALLAGGACDDDQERMWGAVDAGHDAPADMSDDVSIERAPETVSEAPREAGADVSDAEVGDTRPPALLVGILSHLRRGFGDGGTDEEMVSVDFGDWSLAIRGSGAADQSFPISHNDRQMLTSFLSEPGVWETLTSNQPCQPADAGAQSPLLGFRLAGQFQRVKPIGGCPAPYPRFLSLWTELRKRYFGAEVCSPSFVPPPLWMPPFECVYGRANSGCNDFSHRPACQEGRWVCPAGEVPVHLCSCTGLGCTDAGVH